MQLPCTALMPLWLFFCRSEQRILLARSGARRPCISQLDEEA